MRELDRGRAGGGGGNACVGDRERFEGVAVCAVIEDSIEVGGPAVDHACHCAGELLVDVRARGRIVFSKVVAVGDVDVGVLASADDEVVHGAAGVGLVGQEKSSGGAEVEVRKVSAAMRTVEPTRTPHAPREKLSSRAKAMTPNRKRWRSRTAGLTIVSISITIGRIKNGPNTFGSLNVAVARP